MVPVFVATSFTFPHFENERKNGNHVKRYKRKQPPKLKKKREGAIVYSEKKGTCTAGGESCHHCARLVVLVP
jgi:hypothetical protein